MSVDLLRQQQRWKDTLMEIREIMASLVQEGFNPDNMRPWRLHWDHQLYKALEHQYQLGLEALSENLPEIKVEMIYRYMAVYSLEVFTVRVFGFQFFGICPSQLDHMIPACIQYYTTLLSTSIPPFQNYNVLFPSVDIK